MTADTSKHSNIKSAIQSRDGFRLVDKQKITQVSLMNYMFLVADIILVIKHTSLLLKSDIDLISDNNICVK